VLAARGKKKLERIAEELRPVAKVMIVPMDVADADACLNLLRRAKFEFGGIHVLVNNAGFHKRGPVSGVDAADLGRMIDVNLRAPVVLSKLAIPYLVEARGAAIINVASLAGRLPVAGAAVYSASKFGLRAFTFALGEELAASGIKLAAVSPGPIDTGFIMSNIDEVADITFSQPLSTADEVAEVIVQLCINDKRERSMPPASGFLTTTGYLLPRVMRLLRPLMLRRGQSVKRRLKAKLREAGQDK
jgi:short-subunit dehydrogenase